MAKKIKTGSTGATVTRTGKNLTRVEGPNYNGQTPANIRASAKIASAGNKSKPYQFQPWDAPSASGTRAYKSASVKKTIKKIKKIK